MATEPKRATTLSWRKLLASEAGIEGMLFLNEQQPSIHKGESHAIIFDAGRVEGYRLALAAITDLLTLRQEKEINASNDD